MEKIVLTSLSVEELREVIRDLLRQELEIKKEKEIISFKETCALLSCSSSALNKWKSENRLPHYKLGKRIFFKKQEILKAMKIAK